MSDLAQDLRAKLDEIDEENEELCQNYFKNTDINKGFYDGQCTVIGLLRVWLDSRPDGWTDVDDGLPKHNRYVNLIVKNKGGSRQIVLAWLATMPGGNVWLIRGNKKLSRAGRVPIAWKDRYISPTIPARFRKGKV